MFIYYSLCLSHITMNAEKIDKRSYAYECLKCRSCRGGRRYAESHVHKSHLNPSEVPFYCTLLLRVQNQERTCSTHYKGYKPHKEALAALATKGEPIPELDQMLKRNLNPRPTDGTLMIRLTIDESKRVWEHRLQEPVPKMKTIKDGHEDNKIDTDMTPMEVQELV